MSFTFGISRAGTLLLAAAASAGWVDVSAAGGSQQVCADYAKEAFYTIDDMKQISCGEVDRSGAPGRFTVNYNEHYNWCRQHSTPQARAFETKARNDAKSACLAKPKNKAQQAKKDMCKAYSDKALEESNEMREAKCEEVGSMWNTRYSLASNHHRDWCMNESTPQTLKFERETRTAARNACMDRKMREVFCQKYATDAVQMSNEYQINRCTTEHHPTGRFDYRYQKHYNWCYTASTYTLVFSEEDARKAELQSCKERNEASKQKPITKQKFQSVAADESADTDSSEEPALQVSDAVNPVDPDASYTPIKKLKIKPPVEEDTADIIDVGPAPMPRTEKIVVGNRYVEVPAYSEEAGIDTGRVIKTGAAAVVVGTAAVATGAVAAKAIDHAADYEGGGINKAMSGAAEAVKDKLENRVASGGGMTKAMSGAAEAAKEKIKDRVASGGGITKAMSGAKEALKSKLKDRSGDGLVSKAASGFKEKVKYKLSGGGGGLMKGMAKASGGLLRRLAGR